MILLWKWFTFIRWTFSGAVWWSRKKNKFAKIRHRIYKSSSSFPDGLLTLNEYSLFKYSRSGWKMKIVMKIVHRTRYDLTDWDTLKYTRSFTKNRKWNWLCTAIIYLLKVEKSRFWHSTPVYLVYLTSQSAKSTSEGSTLTSNGQIDHFGP